VHNSHTYSLQEPKPTKMIVDGTTFLFALVIDVLFQPIHMNDFLGMIFSLGWSQWYIWAISLEPLSQELHNRAGGWRLPCSVHSR
jgi:hypothetical protein